MKKVFKKIKDIFLKIFGKAWWFLIAFGIAITYIVFTYAMPGLGRDLHGLKNEENDGFLRETYLDYAESFSVNDYGKVVVTSNMGSEGMAAVMDFGTWDKSFSNINMVTIDAFDDDYFSPYNAVITDDNIIYAVRSEFGELGSIYTCETIVRLSEDYEYLGAVCEIRYEFTDRLRQSKISRLHYHNDTLTFAVTEADGVWLYSVDTKSQVITKSDIYPTDENGTFTISVIPVDDAFLFIRSDGNVYQTKFNEPLTEVIYKVDPSIELDCEHPCFDLAAVVNGKLYVADSINYNCIFQLENGELKKAFDINVDYSYIASLDSYHVNGSDNESLIVCLDNGVYTYDGTNLEDQECVISFDPTFLMYFSVFMEVLLTISLICLGINLIVRKKTLLYKQLILILPVIFLLTAIIAYYVYVYNDENIELGYLRELTVICDLGKSEFDGYDFSDLMKADDKTGAAYKDLQDKFYKLSTAHGDYWSDDYVFSVVYKVDDSEVIVLAADDTLYMPLHVRDRGDFSWLTDEEGGNSIDDGVVSFIDDDNMDSKLSVLRKISDKDSTDNFYLMVSSDRRSLYSERLMLLGEAVVYSFVIIFILTLLIVLTSLNTMRVIKKASTTVKKLSSGDLSARVNYKSKDELGQICSEVNEMGQNLEKMFDEKDKTEKFYYKFVPEKFRELLGKENFTDLNLGDAKSCELTVLFCDIRGFSINSEMMTAKENFAFANVIYGKMGPIVRKNNGFVDKYIGDAVMGLFEKPDDAVRCGIELYKSIVLDPSTAAELKVSDINIGIGVHTGMAMVGIVGEEERLSGTVISETVNMSSRLESLTKQYKTAMLVSKDTIDRMADPDSLDLRYLGIVQVAGVNEVTALYEVLDCLPETVRPQRSANNKDLREAIRLFSLGRRPEAVAALQELNYSGRNDYVTDLYLDYIRNMSDDDKGNVFRFVRK